MTEFPTLTDVTASETRREWRKREVSLAFTNAVKLGISMVATWGIALITRLILPRYLGPERFGILNFAEAFSATAFVFMGLGLDQYVRKEISVRPGHASDFVGGIVALRLILFGMIGIVMEVVLRVTHRDSQVRLLVYICAFSQYFMTNGITSAGLLQSIGRVTGISILSVAIKLAWGVGILSVVFLRLELWAVALTGLIAEGARSWILFVLARRELHIELRIRWTETKRVVVASLPFFVSAIVGAIYDKLGINILAVMTNNREVGWYGAAAGLHGITFMLAPLVGWILTPLFARAATEAVGELYQLLRRSMEFMVALATPLSVMMALGADTWVSLLYGNMYAPAANVLRILAIGTVPMYLSIIAFSALTILNQPWRMSMVFLSAIIVNPIFTVTLIRHFASGGDGAGGASCAVGIVLTECAIVGPFLYMLGRDTFDRRLVGAITKNAVIAVVVACLDRYVLIGLHPYLRLFCDSVSLGGLALTTGALDIRGMMRMVRASRKQSAAVTTAN
jgi:O-antigen/teichoic acid export membrane protein